MNDKNSIKVVDRNAIDGIISLLKSEGFITVGPTLRDKTIIYDEIENTSELPIGWTDEQEAGHYRIKRRNDEALFGYNVGPHSWKKYLFPPKLELFEANKNGKSFEIKTILTDTTKYAFIGVRSCELHAIQIQDKVFNNWQYKDPNYVSLRDRTFIIAVNCTQAGKTCFCSSMDTGPRAKKGFDLSITEVINPNEHYFVVESGSDNGEDILSKVETNFATEEQIFKADAEVDNASRNMGRALITDGVKDLLMNNMEHPQWNDVAARCLTCANCTMVCPTCFCNNVEDVNDISGNHTERWRKWDSCFSLDFSKVAGGNFRTSPKARYRQWMTHKLASWIDQFGTSGCVGCGRCITWCPVGIDITKEVKAIQDNPVN
ncbi:MAG: 4Fe-4S dicluster domain-containing protein [Ignavibacteria bacterium]|nr:4Fe-4S dicluster domain-containing protein [Ignavibacteria bacterium]